MKPVPYDEDDWKARFEAVRELGIISPHSWASIASAHDDPDVRGGYGTARRLMCPDDDRRVRPTRAEARLLNSLLDREDMERVLAHGRGARILPRPTPLAADVASLASLQTALSHFVTALSVGGDVATTADTLRTIVSALEAGALKET